MSRTYKRIDLLAIASLAALAGMHAVAPVASAQAVWDGNGDSNASGNWVTDPTFWSTDAAPLGTQTVQLNDVTTGTRIVVVDSAATGLTLGMTQDTVGAVNQMDISNTLTLGSSASPQTLLTTAVGPGVGAGGVVINLNSGGSITTTASGAKTYSNAGTFNFNGGSISLSIGNVAQANRTFTNTGIVNATASGGVTYINTQTGNNQATGIFSNTAGAQLNVTAGTFTFGNAATSAGLRGGTVRVQNSGATSVAPDAVLLIKNNGTGLANNTDGNFTSFDNQAGGLFTLGSAANTPGKGTLFLRVTGGQTSPNLATSFNNAGTATLYGQSVIDTAYGGSSSKSFTVNNLAGGVLNLTPNSTGVVIGSDPNSANVFGRVNTSDYRHGIVVNNDGEISVTPIDPLSDGLVRIGQVTGGGTARNALAFNNNSGANLNLGVDTTARLSNLLPGNVTQANTFNNAAGGTVTLGVSSNAAKGGVLQQQVNGSGTGATAGSAPVLGNSGVINAYGTSVIELASASLNTAVLNTYAVTNTSAGTLNLYDTSRIGNQTKVTVFANAGTLAKFQAGIAEVRSAAGGTNANTGVINVNAGTLAFSQGLASSDGTIDVASGATLSTAGLSVSGGTLRGTGAISGNVTLSGTATLAPGTSPGVLSFANDLTLGGTTAMEVLDTGLVRGTDFDGVDITGVLTYGGALSIVADTLSVAPAVYDLFAFTGPDVAGFDEVNLDGDYSLAFANDGGIWTASDGTLDFTFTEATGDLTVAATVVVPEPAALATMAIVSVGLLARRRRAR